MQLLLSSSSQLHSHESHVIHLNNYNFSKVTTSEQGIMTRCNLGGWILYISHLQNQKRQIGGHNTPLVILRTTEIFVVVVSCWIIFYEDPYCIRPFSNFYYVSFRSLHVAILIIKSEILQAFQRSYGKFFGSLESSFSVP